ncbi:MAG: aminoacetone oxidase family FAD-binding enzyme [Gemmatimonadota bacterium]|nr:aminoacetone oxidase family FAD-binding enzyme [Gemmatimonadota bacterium]
MPIKHRVGVIGAGAAGSMAAIFAARHGAEVLLLERTRDGGRKILISGGGRCNVLPARVDETRFVTDSSPNLLRKMVRSWPLAEQIAFFEQELNIPLAEETESAKLFPVSNKARDVRDGLLEHARSEGVAVMLNKQVVGMAPQGAGWRIETSSDAPIDVDRLIVASGGLSVPNTGSDGFGLTALAALGHRIHSTYAALTPLTANPAPFASLVGVSLTVTITAKSERRSATATGGFLFTHHGYSGPAVLDVSHVAVRSLAENGPKARITVRWSQLADADWESAFKPNGARTVGGAVRTEMPERLALTLVAAANVDPLRVLSELRRDERLRLIEILVRGVLPWAGDEGYRKAEVTGGGVDLAEIDPRTMHSRIRPNLFLCGEVLDAFGPIGGYNFLWAWVTGRAAGIGAAT